MKCFFCDIQVKDDSQTFLSNELFFARFDDYPINKGHAEIIIKKHIISFFDLEQAEFSSLTVFIKQVKKYLDKEFKPDAYNIGINEGEAAGRTIPHLHIHIIPRYKGDVANPRGGVRNIIPEKADYIKAARADILKVPYIDHIK